MEGNESVYQVYPVSRVTGEGRAEFLRVKYSLYEARNRIHARNGETEETTEVVSSPLLVYINLLALLYVLHA